jgi:hypothetical protein
VAIQIVLASQRAGKYALDHTQWDSIRKIQTVYANNARASPQANLNPLVLGDDKGKAQRFVQDGCSSHWYSRFSIGCKNRMGQDWRPNMALSTNLLCAYFKAIEFRIVDSTSLSELNCWIVIGTYSVVTYGISLCGSEGFLLDLEGLWKYSVDLNQASNYFLIPLMGMVKGEYHDCCHLLPCTFQTKSGIKPYVWINRLKEMKHKQGFVDGPAISDEKGRVLNGSTIDQDMQEILEELFLTCGQLFPSTIPLWFVVTGYI